MSGRPRKAGPLGPQVEGYRAWLAQRGYTPGTIQNMLADLGQVGRWLGGGGAGGGAGRARSWMAAFLHRPARRPVSGESRGSRAMAPLLSYLREVDVAAAAEPS